MSTQTSAPAAASTKPAWLLDSLRDRGLCQCCGSEPYITEWAGGTGELIGQNCLTIRQSR
jgi:hypothetical protein